MPLNPNDIEAVTRTMLRLGGSDPDYEQIGDGLKLHELAMGQTVDVIAALEREGFSISRSSADVEAR